MTYLMIGAWIALNYAVAAGLTHQAARSGGASRAAARRAALWWPAELMGAPARSHA